MEIIKLPKKNDKEKEKRKKDLLDVLTQLLMDVDSGKIDAFITVAMDADGQVYRYQATITTESVELLGALEMVKHKFMTEECK